jgi:uncharacterized membrane protein
MEPFVLEWLNLLLRVAHVIAAIMWIGDSFLFMFLDSHLSKPTRPREGDVVGELWMTHSGGFYEVVKRRSLAASELPPQLFWFKWESYTTWITGFFLLTVVFYLGGSAALVDPTSPLSHGGAVALSLGLLAGGMVVYHLLCLTPLVAAPRAMGVVGLVALCALAYGLGQVFAPRAVFLQLGAMLGTIMSSNVLLRIIPAQQHMLAATRANEPVDTSYGQRAKQRSIHNHYLTLPVLFTMVSNHLPGVYAHPQAWLVLALVFVFLVGVKYAMNARGATHPVLALGTLGALVAVVGLTTPRAGAGIDPALAAGPPVGFGTVKRIIGARCVTCHSATPADPSFVAAPADVRFDTPAEIEAHAGRIFVRAVHTKTMPLGNLTGITDEERRLLGAWIAQGADVNALDSNASMARDLFAVRCAMCHGDGGAGDGPGGVALKPPPRDFRDAAWQAATTDELIRKTIVEGGAAVGKSGTMPAHPDLAADEEVLKELILYVRGFRAGS